MARVFCYIVAASGSPDNIGCAVPYKVDDGEIFYGPCKKLLREWLRHRYLSEATESADPADDVYVVGFKRLQPVENAQDRLDRQVDPGHDVWFGASRP